MFQAPLADIEAKFTKSELGILAWRSQEQYAQTMSKVKGKSSTARKKRPSIVDLPENEEGYAEATDLDLQREEKEEIPFDLPPRFFDEDGKLDLRRVTGPEAFKFYAAQGIHFPMFKSP